MPTPAALSAGKRTSILDSARNAFAEHGYAGASMSAITHAAGVSKSTVYHHYRSKAELFGAFVERECARMLAQHFGAGRMPPGATAQTLRAIGIGMVELITSPVCLIIDRVVTSEAEAFPELARSFYAAGPQQAITHLAAWLKAQTQAGGLAVQDAEFAADQFFTLVQTSIYYRCRLRLHRPSPQQTTHVVDSAVAMFLGHYATEQAASGSPIS
ncbi:TetR/AcrR family transcriptional regulator [Lichenicoccus sp.]|uniref:TetR/AcrR family transcriptional regulator n=1 Tax=Lichenicoccus sp. TaxID=2781899 RepID=UPI003D12DFA0